MILFVCSGNTCRSPMAAALCIKSGIEADSAGLYAMQGAPASVYAQQVMKSMGADLSTHRAHPLHREAMERADRIIAMTPQHALSLKEQYPEFADKVETMPLEISDPFGGDLEDYQQCARRILEAIQLL